MTAYLTLNSADSRSPTVPSLKGGVIDPGGAVARVVVVVGVVDPGGAVAHVVDAYLQTGNQTHPLDEQMSPPTNTTARGGTSHSCSC